MTAKILRLRNEEIHVTYLSYTGYKKHKDPPTQVFCPSRTAVAEKGDVMLDKM